MAKKANILTPHIREVHHALALANFLAYRAETAAKRDISLIQRALTTGRGDILLIGATVAGLDIYANQPEWVPYGGVMVKGKEQIGLISEANGMTQADVVATAYEAVERFVKQISVEYLYCMRGKIPIANNQKKRVARQFGKKVKPENTKPWFEQLVHVLAWQNCTPLFDLLFKHVPGLRGRIGNFAMGDLHVNHQAVEFIRHAKTHMNGRFDQTRFEKLSEGVKKRASLGIRKSFLHGVSWFLPAHNHVEGFVAREAEYAQLLYDALTHQLGMLLDWTPGRDPSTV
jgi:hypothetical protein